MKTFRTRKNVPEIPGIFSNPCDDVPEISGILSNPCDDMPQISGTFSNPCDDMPAIALAFSNPSDYCAFHSLGVIPVMALKVRKKDCSLAKPASV